MTDRSIGRRLVASAEERIGEPFIHHYKPADLCMAGTSTVESCMKIGLGNQNGYDCSGLVIASLCDVLEIPSSDWPRQYRHFAQLHMLAQATRPQGGDIVMFYQRSPRTGHHQNHMGVATPEGQIIHASGLTKIIDKTPMMDMDFRTITTISPSVLVEAIANP